MEYHWMIRLGLISNTFIYRSSKSPQTSYTPNPNPDHSIINPFIHSSNSKTSISKSTNPIPIQNRRHLLQIQFEELSAQNKSDILSQINVLRSDAATGAIQLGASPSPFQSSSRMERYFWDDALMDSAMIKASTCDTATPSNKTQLAISYINNPSRIPIIDPSSTLIGETLYTATLATTPLDAIVEAINQWRNTDCQQLDYFTNGCNNIDTQICDNCRVILQETARYIGCGFSNCSNSIAVACHVYYSDPLNNLATPGAFVPYFDGSGSLPGFIPGCGGTNDNCPSDRQCDSDNLCSNCSSLNYEACVYANNNDPLSPFCPVSPAPTTCSLTGITTAAPTFSPSMAPTFAPTFTIGMSCISI